VVSFKTTNGMGGACGAYEAEDKCIQWFRGETWRLERSMRHLEDNIKLDLKWIFLGCVYELDESASR
jgi:hypothetical protein